MTTTRTGEGNKMSNTTKPLGHKSYGTIPHLPGSRQGRDDVGLSADHAKILTHTGRTAQKKYEIIVQEKLDGSNVAVANIDGILVPMGRSGYPAISSNHEQHKLFAAWVFGRTELFAWLNPGERVCGEWLAQAHGTRYNLATDMWPPFIAFDLIRNRHERAPYSELHSRASHCLSFPVILGQGPMTVEEADRRLGEFGHHGAMDRAEGAVWRAEHGGSVVFLGKYVRADKVDGKYLSSVSGQPEVWNWRPEKAT